MTGCLLDPGVLESMFMAVQQQNRTQIACKIVNLSRLQLVPDRLSSSQTPSPARLFDQRGQTQRIKTWTEQIKRGPSIGDRLDTIFREVDILAQLSHVCRRSLAISILG